MPQALVLQLVERDKHQGATLAGRRWRLDQEVLFTALFIGALLHRAHAKLVGLRRIARLGVGDRNMRNVLDLVVH